MKFVASTFAWIGCGAATGAIIGILIAAWRHGPKEG